jgi:hypothetical protein
MALSRMGAPVGDRRQFLTRMSADVVKAAKLASLEDGMNAWEIMEAAKRNGSRKRKSQRAKS